MSEDASIQLSDAATDALDAARYRWLRNIAHPADDIGLFVGTLEVSSGWGRSYTKHWTGKQLDKKITAAMKKRPAPAPSDSGPLASTGSTDSTLETS